MNKEALVTEMARNSNLTKLQSEAAVNIFIEIVGKALSEDDKVVLVGFGTFEPYQRSERAGRNPRTGASLLIPAARMVRFSAGKILKGVVAGMVAS